jgi:predicted TIM-barrel fold metal-dependent hydrolase
MIVDLDTRFWPRIEDLGAELGAAVRALGSSRWLQPDATTEAHAAAVRAVDAAVVVGFRSELVRGAIAEDALRGAVERGGGRLFLARAIDPSRPDATAEVESARKEGAAALWMDPCTQGFNPTDTRAMRVFDRAEANQLPVFLGWSGPLPASGRLEFARPYLLDEVARAFPRLAIVIGGFGAPFPSETIALVAKHDRVFTTTAGIAARPWELLNALQCARDHAVDRKVCFASGYPFDTPARAIEAIYGVNGLVQATQLPHIARSALREIVERDSVSLLGLGVPPAAGPRDTTRSLATDGPLRLTGETG